MGGQARSDERDSLRLNVDSPENLAHTRVVSVMVDGRPIHRPKWNRLMDELHVLGLKQLGSFDALKRASGARLRPGRFEEEGFKYIPEGDFSIQGVDSNLAWDHSLGLARVLGVPLKVVFEWRHKDAAVHPGQMGVLEWSPKPA